METQNIPGFSQQSQRLRKDIPWKDILQSRTEIKQVTGGNGLEDLQGNLTAVYQHLL
jgi:hypothetical protein